MTLAKILIAVGLATTVVVDLHLWYQGEYSVIGYVVGSIVRVFT